MKPRFWIAGTLVVLGLAAGWVVYDSKGSSFERLVYPDRDAARELKSGQASCMHCPMYYRLDASPDVIGKLIAQHELDPVTAMPEFMEQTISLFTEDWWIDRASLARAKKYWVMFNSNTGSESRVRLVLVDGTTVYVATNGLRPDTQYRKIPLDKQPLGTGTSIERMK